VKYVLCYRSSPDVLRLAPISAAEHRAWWQRYRDAGTLLMIGPFADPTEGAMGVFTSREAAEEFAAGDPFVLNGVVSEWLVREWIEVIVPEES
jgi:uncharacterized protein